MGVTIEFIRNGRVAVSHYDKNLTVADIESAFKQITPHLDRATAPIYSIADFSQVWTMPPKILSLAHNYQKEIKHPMNGKYIVITRSSFLQTMLNTVVRFIPGINLKMVSTMDEALAEVDSLLAAEGETKPI